MVLLKVTRIINASPLLFMPPKLTTEQKVIRDVEKKEYFRRYYAANRAEQIEYSRQWRANNPDKCKEQDAARKRLPYAALPEKQKESAKASSRKWREVNPEKYKEYCAKVNTRRREAYRTDAAYREARKAESRLIMPEIQRFRRARLKAKVFDHYGRMCACCGETEEAFLTLGHVNGDGAAHRKSLNSKSGGPSVYLDVIRRGFPKDFRVECYNCNCGSFRNGGVCPHERDRLIKVAPFSDVSTDNLPCAPEDSKIAPGLVN